MIFWTQYKKKKKSGAHSLMDIDKLQSANVPSCALISKRSQPASYSLPCVTLVQSGEPGRRVFCNKVLDLVGNIHLKRCGPQTCSQLCVLKGKKKKKVKSTDTQTHLSLLDKTRTVPGRPLLFTAVSCLFLAQKVQDVRRKYATKGKDK